MICSLVKFIFVAGLALLISVPVASQQNLETIKITDLGPDGILLDRGWKFSADDNAEFANPGYDDSAWRPIDPTSDIVTSLPEVPEGQICWMRISLSVDSAVTQWLMELQQSVASEVYLNGKLIHRFGVLEGDDITALSPNQKFLSIPFEKGGPQLLAVRFVKQPHIPYGTHWDSSNPCVKIVLRTVEDSGTYNRQVYGARNELNSFLFGIFLILAILYLAFYAFYPEQKANLLFSIYAFQRALSSAVFTFAYFRLEVVELYTLLKYVFLFFWVFGDLILLAAVYYLLKRKWDWIFYIMLLFGIICIPFGFFAYDWGWKIYGGFFTHALNIVITLVAVRSFSSNRMAAWIAGIGGICFMFVWVVFTLGLLPDYGIYLFVLAHLSIPLAVSIYLGYEFARTNRSLRQKLNEVSILSQEKQQMLAEQNETLEKQVTERTSQLKKSLEDLRSAQAQLIQSEKMASLGELTAGIAHEIQNPLNFVNNFSELNKELIDELMEKAYAGSLNEVQKLASDIKQNEAKIEEHGKRADGIVKNMLQHSRSTSGQKELIDINALCDEYLRLAYHGYRAKDKSFNAQLTTNFDSTISKVTAVRQDIGRAMLNLLNNAFYAVHQKSKHTSDGHQPTITIATKNINGKIEIRIRDNGNGITATVKEKIFQPFFTTKPTGEGTGLGLSLAYDIITKAHGGEINVETKEGEGSEFIIRLPAL